MATPSHVLPRCVLPSCVLPSHIFPSHEQKNYQFKSQILKRNHAKFSGIQGSIVDLTGKPTNGQVKTNYTSSWKEGQF